MRRCRLSLAFLTLPLAVLWIPTLHADEADPSSLTAPLPEMPTPDPGTEEAVAAEATTTPVPSETPSPTPVPTAEPTAEPTETPEAQTTPIATPPPSDSDEHEGGPEYQRVLPQWALGISASLSAFPDTLTPPHMASDEPIYGTQLVFDFQPSIFQSAGVFGLGVVAEFLKYPGSFSNSPGMNGIGGELRYQAYYVRQQWLVPYMAYQWVQVFYDFKQGPKGILSTSGPLYGISLLLNGFSQQDSGEFYEEWGIARSYLFAELHTEKGIDRGITLQGRSLFFGLRLEW